MARLALAVLIPSLLLGWAAPSIADTNISSLPFTANGTGEVYHVTGNLSGSAGILIDCDGCAVNGHGYTLTTTSYGIDSNSTASGYYVDSLTVNQSSNSSITLQGTGFEARDLFANGAGMKVRNASDFIITNVDSHDPGAGNRLVGVADSQDGEFRDCDWYINNVTTGSAIATDRVDFLDFYNCSFIGSNWADNMMQAQFANGLRFFGCYWWSDDNSAEALFKLRDTSTGTLFDGCTIIHRNAPNGYGLYLFGGTHTIRNSFLYGTLPILGEAGANLIVEGCYINAEKRCIWGYRSGGSVVATGNTLYCSSTRSNSLRDGCAVSYDDNLSISWTIRNNIMITEQASLIRVESPNTVSSSDYNHFFVRNPIGSIDPFYPGSRTWSEWQAAGYDANSSFGSDPELTSNIWAVVDSLANVRPLTDSPVIDAGQNSAVTGATPPWIYDVYDTTRVVNGTVDIGAAEWQSDIVVPLGACCFANGSCQVVAESACPATWQGAGTVCSPNPCPQPTGACCETDGDCAVLDQATCEGAGGTWNGGGTTCSPDPCEDFGACCYSSGTCELLFDSDCTAAGGTLEADGSVCSPNPCTPPQGACCDGGATCEVRAEADCQDFLDEWLGEGTTCSPDPCADPQGACCNDFFSTCSITTETGCGAGQTYQGDATTCSPDPCDPLGACCRTSGVCILRTAAGCAAISGATYIGDEEECESGTCVGACCLEEVGTCQVLTASACSALGASYAFQGLGTVCDPTPCAASGACCFGSGSCSILSAADCSAAGGTYLGDSTTCDVGACFGACCFASGDCQVNAPATCATQSGTFSGVGSTCAPNLCPQPSQGSCCIGDLTTCVETDSVSCMIQAGEFTAGGDCTPNPCVADSVAGACCLPLILPPPGEDLTEAACVVRTQSGCVSIGGTYWGDETVCSPNPCPAPDFGACCLGSGQCLILPPDECVQGPGGSYQGDGEPCNPNPCPIYYVNVTCGALLIPRHNTLNLVNLDHLTYLELDVTGEYLQGEGEFTHIGHLTFDAVLPAGAQILQAELLAHVVESYGDTLAVGVWDCSVAAADADGSTYSFSGAGAGHPDMSWTDLWATAVPEDRAASLLAVTYEFPAGSDVLLASGDDLEAWVSAHLRGGGVGKRSLLLDLAQSPGGTIRLEDFALRVIYECGGRRRNVMRWLWE